MCEVNEYAGSLNEQDLRDQSVIWRIGSGRALSLGTTATLMGILNVTPDSFSDGGTFADVEQAAAHARDLKEAGAAVVDVGGESTRPGADPIDGEEERARVLPVIERLAGEGEVVISLDTYRAETARAAVDAGAHIINDVWGCQKEPDIAHIAAETGAGLVLMHNARDREALNDVIEDQRRYFETSLDIAVKAGVASSQIVLDPGFGFGKDEPTNLQLLNRLDELHTLGFPLLVGTSRKRFLGAITGRDAAERDVATSATSVVARMKGAAIFRVHDIAVNRDGLAVADALLAESGWASWPKKPTPTKSR